MDRNENTKEKLNKFLEENKIRVTGGQITTVEQMSSLLNKISKNEISKGKFDKGLYFASKAIEFNSEDYYSVFLKGISYRYLGKYGEAIKELKYHYEHMKDKASLINLGFCYAESNDSEKALECFNKAVLNLTEEEEKEYLDLLMLMYECMGNIYLSREDILEFDETDKFKINYKLAIKYYKKSLKINRLNHLLLNKLAACYYHFDDIPKALYCYEQAAKASPEDKRYIDAVNEIKNMGVVSEVIDF